MAARTATMSSILATTTSGAHVTQRAGARVQLAYHGAYAMALFQQDGEGHARGRADAAGGAGDEDGFLGHDLLLIIEQNEHEQCIPSTRFDYSDDDRSIGLWYRSAPGISQCRQLALCWMDEEQIRGGIQPRNGRPVYGLHKYAVRGIEPRLCICVVRAVASRSAIPQVPPFAGVGVRGLSSSNIARQRSLKPLSGLLAAWLYPHLSGCPPLTTSNSRERSAWTAATASVILRT